ncbi:hypothetical protein [Nocardia sp. NPDC052566]|uniref:hypothetical protein n=1 Tax=Nocardia sp. NPDC052566 TaxID=3364330 RepID=UPI0037CA3202
MSFRELLDVPFAVIQANILVLAGFGAAVLVTAEAGVLAATAAGSALTDGADAGTTWSAVLSTAFAILLLRCVLRGVTVPIGLAAVAGTRLGWTGALAASGARLHPLLIFQLMFSLIGLGLLALGGGLLFTLPWIGALGSAVIVLTFFTLPAALVWLGSLRASRFLTVPAIFAEQADYTTAVARSKLLTAGTGRSITGLYLTQRCLLVLLAVPLLGVPLYLSDFSGTHRWAVIALITSGVLLIAVFGEIVESTTRVVSYVDLRCRREGMDIRIPDVERR